MLNKALTFIIGSLISGSIFAQTNQNPNEFQEQKHILYKDEWSLGLTLHSSGWGGFFRKGKNETITKKRMWEIEFVGMSHPKEVKSVNPYYENAKSFVFGKINALGVLRAGYGFHRVLWEKGEVNGVEIRLNYTGGLSLGLAKPVYLIFANYDPKNNSDFVTERYDPENPHHSLDNIVGRAEFLKGFDEIKPYPGLYARVGFTFEYAPYDDDVRALEVGIIVDAYPKTIPIMAYIENKQVYFNLYLSILFGRKYN